MNWEAFGSIGEILGAIAVVASLFYVGRQVKQSSRAIRGQTFESITNALNVTSNIAAQDPELLDIMLRGVPNEELNYIDKARYSSVIWALIRSVHSAHYQVQLGLLEEVRLDSVVGITSAHMASETGRTLWDSVKTRHDNDFQNYVDRLIESADSDSVLRVFGK